MECVCVHLPLPAPRSREVLLEKRWLKCSSTSSSIATVTVTLHADGRRHANYRLAGYRYAITPSPRLEAGRSNRCEIRSTSLNKSITSEDRKRKKGSRTEKRRRPPTVAQARTRGQACVRGGWGCGAVAWVGFRGVRRSRPRPDSPKRSRARSAAAAGRQEHRRCWSGAGQCRCFRERRVQRSGQHLALAAADAQTGRGSPSRRVKSPLPFFLRRIARAGGVQLLRSLLINYISYVPTTVPSSFMYSLSFLMYHNTKRNYKFVLICLSTAILTSVSFGWLVAGG
jgi:hypothetical protein